MQKPILGIHHVTAISSDGQRILDFYTELLVALIRSATISAIKMVVGLIATEGVSGMMEASPT
jgi:catechol 2,3-dioxygenase-like lactoylglutathione lyase family enzyme